MAGDQMAGRDIKQDAGRDIVTAGHNVTINNHYYGSAPKQQTDSMAPSETVKNQPSNPAPANTSKQPTNESRAESSPPPRPESEKKSGGPYMDSKSGQLYVEVNGQKYGYHGSTTTAWLASGGR